MLQPSQDGAPERGKGGPKERRERHGGHHTWALEYELPQPAWATPFRFIRSDYTLMMTMNYCCDLAEGAQRDPGAKLCTQSRKHPRHRDSLRRHRPWGLPLQHHLLRANDVRTSKEVTHRRRVLSSYVEGGCTRPPSTVCGGQGLHLPAESGIKVLSKQPLHRVLLTGRPEHLWGGTIAKTLPGMW